VAQKLAAHQPCFLPSIAFFRKLLSVDIFVIADDYQFTTNAAINRTLIKAPRGAAWLTVPVLTKGLGRQRINQISINNGIAWQARHKRTLEVNYCYAPYFEQFCDDLFLFFEHEWCRLVDLNLALITFLARMLNIPTTIVRSSGLPLLGKSNCRLYEMLQQTDCATYVADMDLQSHLSVAEFERNGFNLEFVDYYQATETYHQQFASFVAGLSIVDLLFNEGIAGVEQLKTGYSGCA